MEKMTAIRLTWFGQACFKVEAAGYSIVLDPFEDGGVPKLGPFRETANEVLCSHGHRDHAGVSCVRLIPGQESPFHITELASYHDDRQGAVRGLNTIRILECGGLKIAHLGDLGGPLTAEQKAALTGLDAVLVPVGGYYTIDGEQAKALIRELRPRVAIPMHYRGETYGYEELETAERFLSGFDNIVDYPQGVLELTRETPEQAAVLACVTAEGVRR